MRRRCDLLMHVRLAQVIAAYAARHAGGRVDFCEVRSADPWQLDVSFAVDGSEPYTMRSLRAGDVPLLQEFGAALSERSKYFFAPYPWADEAALEPAFAEVIRRTEQRIDAYYMLCQRDGLAGGRPAGQFFLWKAGHNPLSAPYGVAVPEVGIAMVDAYQGRGLGRLCMQVLRVVGEALDADALELSTALDNEPGYRTYLSCGYEQVGLIRIPLDVDVTVALAGEVAVTRWRDERQMIYVLKQDSRPAVLDFLAYERDAALKLCAS
jgi:RimJ/RimL family protein N-acetyltransferase